MAKRSKSSSDKLAMVDEIMENLEGRLRGLNAKTQSDAAKAAAEKGTEADLTAFVAQTMERIAAGIREQADTATDVLADEATETGTNLVHRIWEEMERRPLLTVAVAATAGYVLGLVSRDDETG